MLHLVLGLTLVKVDLDGARRRPDRPEQAVGSKAGIVVDELVRVRRKGVNLTPIDVESNERRRPVMSRTIGPPEGALREAHVGVEQELFLLAALGSADAGPVDDRDPDEAVEVTDRRGLGAETHWVDVEALEAGIGRHRDRCARAVVPGSLLDVRPARPEHRTAAAVC